ncbi:MAG: ATPase, T2SS/T4P/T4SS family [Planctomycetota bacterium]
MRRRCFSLFVLGLTAVAVTPAQLFAQSPELLAQSPEPWNGGGGYLSVIKLILIGVVFLIWVRLADAVNKDSMGIGEDTGLKPEVWNPITAFSFLAGFFAAISVPIFLAGYPIYLLAAFAPPVTYFIMRRAEIKKSPMIAQKAATVKAQAAGKKEAGRGGAPGLPPLPQDEGPEITFKAAGDKQEQQMNLIRARQAPEDGYTTLKLMLDEVMTARAARVLMDYTRDAAMLRMEIDGAWHPLPPMDRIQGDAMLSSLKHLAGLNPAERRAKQVGTFELKTLQEKCGAEVVSSGVQTGERIQLVFKRATKTRLTPVQLGMFPEVTQRVLNLLNNQGISIISAMPGGGLTTTWQSLLDSSDRITRDVVALIDKTEVDSRVENIVIHEFDRSTGGSVSEILKPVMLTQPDCLIVPDISDQETMELIMDEVKLGRSAITRVQARSAAEALLRMLAVADDRKGFAENARVVTNQRMFRRLCQTCKVPMPVAPQTIQKLGGDPRTQNTIYDQYRLPPPEQRVDEKGRPIEFPPCETCAGLGYIGRIAAFDVLEVDDNVRAVLNSAKPTVDAIEAAASKSGKRTIAAEAYRLVLLGITSVGEVQRVMKPAAKK